LLVLASLFVYALSFSKTSSSIRKVIAFTMYMLLIRGINMFFLM
jgi:hypothetical protein